jgi:hypothetical protein
VTITVTRSSGGMSNANAITIVYTIAVIATNVPADIYSNNVLLATILWNQTFTG